MEKVARYFTSKLTLEVKMLLARDLLHEVLDSEGYSIGNNNAVDIIETVVKSSGNSIVDFVVAAEA